MNTPPYTVHPPGLSGASYTDSSDDDSPVRPATTPAIVGSSECMESGAGQSIEIRNIRPLDNTSNYVDRSKPLNEAPILAACRNNQIDLLQDLLAAEPALAYRAAPSDITDKVRVYLYPLGVAAQEGHEKAVEPLLTAWDRLSEGKRPGGGSIMAVINTADRSGRTPLHLAALGGHIQVVEQLLKAVERLPETERPAAVQRLLNATDDGGQTPLQLARRQNHQEVAVLLRDALQKPAQTARLDSIIPEDFGQPGSSKLPAAQPGTSNESFEVSAQSSLPVDTLKPKATYVAPLLSYDEVKTAEMHLHRAAKNGNIESLERWLSTTPFYVINTLDVINTRNIAGETPLWAAARYGHAECVKALLRAPGILVNEKNNIGSTPPFLDPLERSINSQIEFMDTLFNEKNNYRSRLWCAAYFGLAGCDKDNYDSPLCAAARFDHAECVKVLLTAPGICVNIINNDGLTPLHFACRCGHAECVKALLTDPGILVNDNNNRYGLTPLHYAAKSGHEACLRLLIASKNMKITLLDAAWHGETRVLEEILENLNALKEPAKSEVIMLVLNVVDQDGKNLLCRAAQAGHEKVVALLLNVLNGLSKEKKPEATRAVLSAADSFGRTPLHIAAHLGHYKIVTQLLAEDVETGFSYTCVASKGQEQLAELLKAFPILSAARNGQTTIVARMLKILETWPESERCRAVTMVMTLSNKDGETALHVAAQSGQQKVVEQLLNTLDGMTEPERAHAIQKVLHAVDAYYGATPLHWAASKGYHKVVGQLLDAVGRLPARAMRKAFTAVVNAFDQKVVEQFLSTANNYQESEQQIVAFEAMIGAVVTFKRSPLAAADFNVHWVIGYQLIKAFPLLSAVLGGHNQSVKQLMQVLTVFPREERGAAIMVPLMETRADGATPLYIAASQGNIEIMKPLLSAVTILLADGKRKEAREVLYSACTVKEEDGTLMAITPLRIAAINRHDKAVNLLLAKIRELFIT